MNSYFTNDFFFKSFSERHFKKYLIQFMTLKKWLADREVKNREEVKNRGDRRDLS